MSDLLSLVANTGTIAFANGFGAASSHCVTAPRAVACARDAVDPGIQVLIAAASPAMLCGLEALVGTAGDTRVVGTAHSLDQLLTACARAGPAVALVDPALGGLPLRAFMCALKVSAPRVRALLMTDGHQPHVVREALRLGAYGLVGMTADADELRAALVAVAAGRRYISPAMTSHLAESLTLDELTNREAQVLARLSLGDCNKTIARQLEVTVGTVKTHVRAIMGKLGSRSRTEAVHNAYRLGLLSHEP
jgi:DNA-binding NarL/FixJ family response regulator